MLTALCRTMPATHIHIVSLASDGESRHAKVLINLCYRYQLSPNSPIYEHLSGLELRDLYVREDDLTADKDGKHVFKRCRNPFLSVLKSILVHGVCITSSQLCLHLLDSGKSPEHVNSVLNPSDKHDILLAFCLLKDMWTLPAANPLSHPASYIATREAICTYGEMCYHLIFPYICTNLSLDEQLEHLSAGVHLAVALFADQKVRTDFLGIVLIVNIILMVKNVYFCVAKAKADLPNEPFFIILLGTDSLESLFGILCTMVGNDANLDVLQLGLCVTNTTEVATILAMHPEWGKGPRRLHLPHVDCEARTLPDNADHIGPSSFYPD
ncbi:unnamed protein product [Peniophora sp. CBMAI 1063]|nr:unnamed protein product [Peniophora sp. CBMAI 1063]